MKKCTCEIPNTVHEKIDRNGTAIVKKCVKCGYYYDEMVWQNAARQRSKGLKLTGKTRPFRKRSRLWWRR